MSSETKVLTQNFKTMSMALRLSVKPHNTHFNSIFGTSKYPALNLNLSLNPDCFAREAREIPVVG